MMHLHCSHHGAFSLQFAADSGLKMSSSTMHCLCRGLDANVFRPDFMSFNHRGHAIPLAVEPLNTAAKKTR